MASSKALLIVSSTGKTLLCNDSDFLRQCWLENRNGVGALVDMLNSSSCWSPVLIGLDRHFQAMGTASGEKGYFVYWYR